MSEIKFTTNSASSSGKSGDKKYGKYVGIGVVAVLVLIVLFNCFTIVNEGFIGVKYRFGQIVNDGLTAGLNFRIPFVEEIEQVDI